MFQNIPRLVLREFRYRWVSAILVILVVATTSGALTFFRVNREGYRREIVRNSRDIGSNVVILPSQTDQVSYHLSGGYTEDTMPQAVVDQLVEYRASMNHLIPMLERKTTVTSGDLVCEARVVGLTASVPMPGRPKSPMQRAVAAGRVQLGSQVAEKLGCDRDQTPVVSIAGEDFQVQRVNRSTGTWQDGAVLMDLAEVQELFELEGLVSRIEAIECTSEKCELTGMLPDDVLRNEIANISEHAQLLRKEELANSRMSIRTVTDRNSQLLEFVLWTSVLITVGLMAWLNTHQRQGEIGVLRALGHLRFDILAMFVGRIVVLAATGAVIGVATGGFLAVVLSRELFVETGSKFTLDQWACGEVFAMTLLLSVLAGCVPAMWAASQHPADVIGKS